MSISDWLGIALIVAGIFLAVYSYFENIKKVKTSLSDRYSNVDNAVSDFQQLHEGGLTVDRSQRKYYEIVGRVYSDNLTFSPFSNKNTAYCETTFYINDSSAENAILYSEKSFPSVYISDNRESSKKLYLDFDSLEDFLDLEKGYDEIIPVTSSVIKNIPGLDDALKKHDNVTEIRVVEKSFKPNCPLYTLGEIFNKDDKTFIGKSVFSDKPTLVRIHKDINVAQRNRYRGITLGSICVAVGMIFIVFINK